MRAPLLCVVVSLSALTLMACDEDTTPGGPSEDSSPDLPDSHSADMSPQSDLAGGDQGADERCTTVAIAGDFMLDYAEGVAVQYGVAYAPQAFPSDDSTLKLLFERYSPGEDVGTFKLGAGGADENFGDCAHCVYIKTESAERAYFATAGTLTLSEDPYSRELDVKVEGLELREVSVDGVTRASTLVDGGGCVRVRDFSSSRIFPAAGWTCEEARYKDGEACDCECGAVDPDCNGPTGCLPGDEACGADFTPLPVVGCEAGEQCLFDPETMGLSCVSSCDWEARSLCASGICLYDTSGSEGDTCVESAARFVDVEVGEACLKPGETTIYQLYCALDEGFATGYCDAWDVCREVCQEGSECEQADHTCRLFAATSALGYCGPEPPVDG